MTQNLVFFIKVIFKNKKITKTDYLKLHMRLAISWLIILAVIIALTNCFIILTT